MARKKKGSAEPSADAVTEVATEPAPWTPDEGRAFRIVATVVAIVTSLLTRTVLRKAWKFVMGRRPPANPESPDTTMREAVSWALLTGMVIGAARMLAIRRVAKTWKKSADRQAAAAEVP